MGLVGSHSGPPSGSGTGARWCQLFSSGMCTRLLYLGSVFCDRSHPPVPPPFLLPGRCLVEGFKSGGGTDGQDEDGEETDFREVEKVWTFVDSERYGR